MMGTIFKAAMNHVRAEEDLKRKTKDYLTASLSVVPAVTKSRPKRSMRQRAALAACAVVCVCAISAAVTVYYKTPTSYLSLDINPGVELGVNGFGRVVSATAYDSGGATILNGLQIMDVDVESAVHTLVRSAVQKGFVAQDGSTVISVTSETDNTSAAVELENTAAQGVETAIKSEGKTATINKDRIPLEKRDEAKRLAITPGKLSLIQKLQALDPSVTVSEYKDAQIKDIVKRIDELKESANPGGDGAKDTSVPADDGNAFDGTADKDTTDSSGTGGDKNPQETCDENSSVSPAESGKNNASDSSDAPEKETSHTASDKKKQSSSQAQSHSGSTSSAKSSSRSSSSLSSRPKR